MCTAIVAQAESQSQLQRIHTLCLADGSIVSVELDRANTRKLGAYLYARTLLLTETCVPRLVRAIKTLHAMETMVIRDRHGHDYRLLTDPRAILRQERRVLAAVRHSQGNGQV